MLMNILTAAACWQNKFLGS